MLNTIWLTYKYICFIISICNEKSKVLVLS